MQDHPPAQEQLIKARIVEHSSMGPAGIINRHPATVIARRAEIMSPKKRVYTPRIA